MNVCSFFSAGSSSASSVDDIEIRPHQSKASQNLSDNMSETGDQELLTHLNVHRTTSDTLLNTESMLPINMVNPANIKRWPIVGLMLGQCGRGWANVSSTLAQCPMFAGMVNIVNKYFTNKLLISTG